MPRKNEGGYIVVETVGGFILFVFLIVSILSLVNVVIVQNRVHFALTQAAQELSTYCYGLQVTGIADEIRGVDTRSDELTAEKEEFSDNVNKLLDGLGTLGDPASLGDAYDAGADIWDSVHSLAGEGKAWMESPQTLMAFLMSYGADELKNEAGEIIVKKMFEKYISNGVTDPDTYLKGMNVIGGTSGVDFDGTTLLDADGDITLVISYEIDYSFGALPLPFTSLKVTQTAMTKAWLDGDGNGYEETGDAS